MSFPFSENDTSFPTSEVGTFWPGIPCGPRAGFSPLLCSLGLVLIHTDLSPRSPEPSMALPAREGLGDRGCLRACASTCCLACRRCSVAALRIPKASSVQGANLTHPYPLWPLDLQRGKLPPPSWYPALCSPDYRTPVLHNRRLVGPSVGPTPPIETHIPEVWTLRGPATDKAVLLQETQCILDTLHHGVPGP